MGADIRGVCVCVCVGGGGGGGGGVKTGVIFFYLQIDGPIRRWGL